MVSIGLRPATQSVAQCAGGSRPRQSSGPYPLQELVAEGRTCSVTQAHPEWRASPVPYLRALPDRPRHWRTRDESRPRYAVQQVAKGQQDGGLAGLARCVEDEIPLIPNQGKHIAEIETSQRRDAVVLPRVNRTGGVEETHDASMACRPGDRPRLRSPPVGTGGDDGPTRRRRPRGLSILDRILRGVDVAPANRFHDCGDFH